MNVYDKQSYQAMIFITKLKHLLSLLITLLRASLLNKSINFFFFILHTPIYSTHIKQSPIMNYIITTFDFFIVWNVVYINIINIS